MTLTNRNGGSVPPGAVTIKSELEARSAWFAQPLFQGLAQVHGVLWHGSLVAS